MEASADTSNSMPPCEMDLGKGKTISIVVPMFNEGEAIDIFHLRLTEVISKILNYTFEIICVDDGSRDDTLERLVLLSSTDPRYSVIELSTNFGKEAALTAGLIAATGDAVVPIDADLQDPPDLIGVMISEWEKGAEVVLAKRSDRSSDGLLKRNTAAWFYRIHNKLSRTKIPENVGDFRLMDRKVIDALNRMPERNRFMKGMFAWVGYKTAIVEYSRPTRSAGTTKFTGWKLWNFALEGLTSFSTLPLRLWSYIGMVGVILSILFAIFIVARTLMYGPDTAGYPSLIVAVVFFGSVQLISIGIVGEYVGRVYTETKGRPIYLVRNTYRGGNAI